MGGCLGTVVSEVVYASEKFSMCFSFTALITCVITSLMFMLAFGIGLGYNYSYVDFRTKHTYLTLEGYRKVRPTSYYGPGYYKPTTLNDSEYFRVYGKTKTTTKTTKTKTYKHNLREAEDEAIVQFDVGSERLPNNSPVDLIKRKPAVIERVDNNGLQIKQLYFSTPKLEPLPLYMVKMTTESTVDVDNTSNDTDVNIMADSSNVDSIRVNVTKVKLDKANPSIIKTMMQPKQLLSWLTRLREANKTFAVQIVTH